jgi:cell division protein FtsL
MPSAVRAQDAYRSREAHRRRDDFRVVSRPDVVADPGVSPFVMHLFKLVIVLVVGLAAIALCRVALTAANTELLVSSQQTSSQLSSLRSQGENLEVEQSRLSNPSRIASSAKALGMVAAGDGDYVTLSDGVTATDSDGDISLSGSIAAASAASGESGQAADQAGSEVAE